MGRDPAGGVVTMPPAPATVVGLTEDEFDQMFAPIPAEDGNSIWEYDAIRVHPRNRVWSVVEVDDDLFVIPDYHVVNVIGYNLTTVPWPHENVEAKLWNPHDEDEGDTEIV